MPLNASQSQQCIVEMFATNTDPAGFTRPDVQAAIAAADQWCTDNAASFNSALPVNFRTKATTAQKAALLASVALRRYGK